MPALLAEHLAQPIGWVGRGFAASAPESAAMAKTVTEYMVQPIGSVGRGFATFAPEPDPMAYGATLGATYSYGATSGAATYGATHGANYGGNTYIAGCALGRVDCNAEVAPPGLRLVCVRVFSRE